MNLPNKISIFRIILVPIILIIYIFPFHIYGINVPVYHLGVYSISLKDIIILILFAIASLSDMVDGKIARSRNLITTFGKFIDPIADKLLVNTLFILLAYSGEVSIVPVIIMIWRDTMVDGMRMMASKSGKVVAAGFSGKLKTVLQMVTIIFALLNNFPFVFISFPMVEILIWISCIISVYSGLVYFNQLKDIIMESK